MEAYKQIQSGSATPKATASALGPPPPPPLLVFDNEGNLTCLHLEDVCLKGVCLEDVYLEGVFGGRVFGGSVLGGRMLEAVHRRSLRGLTLLRMTCIALHGRLPSS